MHGVVVPSIIVKNQDEMDTMLLRIKIKVERAMVDVVDGEFLPSIFL